MARWVAWWLLPFAIGSMLSGPEVVAAPAFAYDAPAAARVDAGPFTPAEASPTQFGGSREESASLSVEARGTSTTSSGSFTATEAATCVALDAVPCL